MLGSPAEHYSFQAISLNYLFELVLINDVSGFLGFPNFKYVCDKLDYKQDRCNAD